MSSGCAIQDKTSQKITNSAAGFSFSKKKITLLSNSFVTSSSSSSFAWEAEVLP
jgi:hypothetical protein